MGGLLCARGQRAKGGRGRVDVPGVGADSLETVACLVEDADVFLRHGHFASLRVGDGAVGQRRHAHGRRSCRGRPVGLHPVLHHRLLHFAGGRRRLLRPASKGVRNALRWGTLGVPANVRLGCRPPVVVFHTLQEAALGPTADVGSERGGRRQLRPALEYAGVRHFLVAALGGKFVDLWYLGTLVPWYLGTLLPWATQKL